MPSVLCADDGVSAVPALLVAVDGVLMLTPQTTNPLAASLTWNLGALCSVIRYSVKLVPFETWISAGLSPPAPLTSHHDCVAPICGSPPCPSMAPSPTMPELVPRTTISAEALPYTAGSRVPNSVTPASTQRVIPGGTVMGPVMNALLPPLAASLTACPAAQPFSAVWMRVVSRLASLGGVPAGAVKLACSVAQAGGMVGSAGRVASAGHAAVPPLPVVAPPAPPVPVPAPPLPAPPGPAPAPPGP